MRDIRNDLRERTDLVEEQIKAVYVQFQSMFDQLRKEHDAKVVELKMGLAVIAKFMDFEERYIANLSPPSLAEQADPEHGSQKLIRVT